jgi:hypothetical protein
MHESRFPRRAGPVESPTRCPYDNEGRSASAVASQPERGSSTQSPRHDRFRTASGHWIDGEHAIAIVAKRSRQSVAAHECSPSKAIVPRPPQLLLLLGEHPGHLDRQIVSSMAGIPS